MITQENAVPEVGNKLNPIDTNQNFIDVLFILLKWKNKIIISVLTIMIISFGITLMMSKWYKATAVLVIPDKSSNPLDILTGGLGSISSTVLGVGKTGNERYLAILASRRIQEELIKKYDLMTVFEKNNMEETVKYVDNLLSAESDKKLGTILVSWEFKDDPEKTAEMTNFIVQKLDEINRELSTEQARSSRVFIERRYFQAKDDLKNSEDSLNAFQNKYGIIEIAQQTEASIKAAAELYGEIVATETEYLVMKKTLGENHPDILRTQSKLQELRKLQSKMEKGGNGFDIFIPFKETPDLALKYYRLYRDVQINGKILEFLVPQYEQSKIQEAKDTPTLLVLDEAKPPERHTRPKKLTISLIVGMVTFVVMSL
ncbi:hypothetical protein JNM05_11295, partial [bacterium]|nr:hypothetical protein [bacterium]